MADDAGWHEWREVAVFIPSGKKLFRASAPNYKGVHDSDHTQNLTQKSVDFLLSQGVNAIISFNEFSYSEEMKKRLGTKIQYRHFSTKDGAAPKLQDLKDAVTFFRGLSHAVPVVHCGFGHGRTGTGVTAIQLGSTKGASPTEDRWEPDNFVEKPAQMQVLRDVRAYYQQGH